MQNARALLPQALILLFCGIPRPPPCVLCAIHLSQRTDFSPFTSSWELRAFSSTHTAMQGTPREGKNGFEGLQRDFFFASGGGSWGLRELLLPSLPLAWMRGPRPDLHVVERAPAAVGVSRAQALPAGRVLLAGLHGHPGHLQGRSTASARLSAQRDQEPKLTFSARAKGCGVMVYGSRIKKTLYNSEIKPSGKTSLLLLLSDPLNWCTHNAFTQNEGKWKGKINGKRISWG